MVAMPRDGAIIFSDLIGKLDMLRVACAKCGRDGSYRLNGLIEKRGRDAKLIDWLDELTAECPKKIAHNMSGINSIAGDYLRTASNVFQITASPRTACHNANGAQWVSQSPVSVGLGVAV